MGLREWTNNHPKATGGVSIACVLAMGFGIAVEVRGNRRAIQTTVPDSFFTVDDGQTFFRASGTNVPPFDYQGQTAVRANVYEVDGKQFVAYMDRYKPDARQVLMSGKSVPPWVDGKGREVKRPGDKTWTSADNIKAMLPIVTVNAPAGSNQTPDPVEP